MDPERFSAATEFPDQARAVAARARLPRPVREQQMLEAASELFGRLGYHSVSMDQIAEAIGVSKPMLYAYFENKEGLCSACVKRAGADMISSLRISSDGGRSPESMLWAGFTAFFEFVRQYPQSWRLIRSKYSYDEPSFQSMVDDVHQELIAEIQMLAASTSGESAYEPLGDVETREAAAYAIFGAAASIADSWVDSGDPGDPEDAATQLLNFFWIGMRGLAAGERFDPVRAF